MTVVKIEAHPKQPSLIVVHAGPDSAAMMGGFQPARWQPNAKAYWLAVEHLEAFQRYLDLKGGTLVDERATGGAVGPLPECRHCGQPARRGVELRCCTGCGQPWEPVVHEAEHMPGVVRTTCLRCTREQRGNLARCGHCGELMPPPAVHRPRPLLVETTREQLADPVPVGQVLDDQLPLDQEETTDA